MSVAPGWISRGTHKTGHPARIQDAGLASSTGVMTTSIPQQNIFNWDTYPNLVSWTLFLMARET